MVSAIMMMYTNTRAKVLSSDGDTDFFDIIAGVHQGDTLAPFVFIICLYYILRTSVDKIKNLGFTLTKYRSSRHTAITITDAVYADDIAFMSDTIPEAQSQVNSLETSCWRYRSLCECRKTKFVSYNQTGLIKTLNAKAMKYVIHTLATAYTEIDVKTPIVKACSGIDGINAVWKSSLPDDIKRDFFQGALETVLVYGSSSWTLTKKLEARFDGT